MALGSKLPAVLALDPVLLLLLGEQVLLVNVLVVQWIVTVTGGGGLYSRDSLRITALTDFSAPQISPQYFGISPHSWPAPFVSSWTRAKKPPTAYAVSSLIACPRVEFEMAPLVIFSRK